jgi:hypothetical protein
MINNLAKIIEGNELYPPSEEIWKKVIGLVRKKEDMTIIELQTKMKNEMDRFKVGLPEPELARFFYDGNYYFLDSYMNIYEQDGDNPLIGNLVGKIEDNTIKIKDKETIILKSLNVVEKELYNNKYYMDDNNFIYKGFHPKLAYIHKIGKLGNGNKIVLL